MLTYADVRWRMLTRCSRWCDRCGVSGGVCARVARGRRREPARYSLYLLYWHKRTNAGAECAACASLHPLDVEEHFLSAICMCMLGTHFTCFTSTEVQILTPEELASLNSSMSRSTFSPVLTLLALLVQKDFRY